MSCAIALVAFDREVKALEQIEEIEGTLSPQYQEDKLMHSVLEGDKQTIEDGKLIQDAVNRGLGSFTPDLMFQNMVRSYGTAKQLYGPRLLSLLTGYDGGYIERNIRIPEFQKELRSQIDKAVGRLKDQGLLDDDERPTGRALTLAALTLYTEELDRIEPKGWRGEREHKRRAAFGDRSDRRAWQRGDKYHELDVRASVRRAARHRHASILIDDLRAAPRKARGSICVIYGLDASGSMRGEKLEYAKKAGVALAYAAIRRKDRVGLVVFSAEVEQAVAPTGDFSELLRTMAGVRASKQTDFVATIDKASQLFPKDGATRHLVLITDALPTVGEEPGQRTLGAVGEARANGVTISIVGVKLDKEGRKLAEEIVRIGEGRLLLARHLDDVDRLVLEDYAAVAQE
jgi:Mg-chelatase subunit ChlD